MLSIGDKEIDFILSDLEERGIVLEDLREDLLDHICCIIENEMTVEDDFERFYRSILPRFFNKELSEIQQETNDLLKFKHFYTMKKLLKISGFSSAILILLGAILKTFHLPGAGICILLGGFSFSILFLPLLILIKFKDQEKIADKLVFGFGLFIGMFMSTGLMFKLMHWPYANALMQYSTMIFTFVYVPVYFLTRIKRAELKFNTTVNSILMIACGGIFYSLFDLSDSKIYSDTLIQNHIYLHENSEKIFASNQRLFESNKENPQAAELRQLSEKVNLELEQLVSMILEKKSTRDISYELQKLDKEVGNYNLQIAKFPVNEIKSIPSYNIEKLQGVSPAVAMDVLARVQQQLAINETCYLSSIISKDN